MPRRTDPTIAEIKNMMGDLKREIKARDEKEKEEHRASMSGLENTRADIEAVVKVVSRYYKYEYTTHRERLVDHAEAIDADNKRMVEELVMNKAKLEKSRLYGIKMSREAADWKRKFMELAQREAAVYAERHDDGTYGTEDAPPGYFDEWP